MVSNPLGGEAVSRAEPPAGPPKTTKSLGEVDFPQISVMFGVMKKTYSYVQLFLKRIARHNERIPG